MQHELEQGIFLLVLLSFPPSSPSPLRFAGCTPQALPRCRAHMCVACESTAAANPLEKDCLHVS